MWRTFKEVGRVCNRCGIKLKRLKDAEGKNKKLAERMFKRRESKRYNLNSLTKEFGEVLARVNGENEKEFRDVLMKCFNRKKTRMFEKGVSVEMSVLNIPSDIWVMLWGVVGVTMRRKPRSQLWYRESGPDLNCGAVDRVPG